MTKASQLASVDEGAEKLDRLLSAVYGDDYRPQGNGTFGLAPGATVSVVPSDHTIALPSFERTVAPTISSRLIGRRIYVSAPWPLKWQARAWRAVLEHAGFAVLGRWLDLPDDTEVSAEGAEIDLEDVIGADILLMINPPDWAERGTGGRHVELGYAIGAGKRLILFGARTNVFHQLPSIEAFDDVDAVLAALEERR